MRAQAAVVDRRLRGKGTFNKGTPRRQDVSTQGGTKNDEGASGAVTPFHQTNLSIQQIVMILAGNISHNILDRNPA
jgi:hypothetical protein